MKVFVTGGGGFLGSYVVRDLIAEGHSVVSFQRSAHPELVALGIEVSQGSLSDREALVRSMRSCDAVIHIAAKAGVWGPSELYYSVNVTGTSNVLSAMEANNIHKLVFCSSPSVVFNGNAFMGEDESLPYGREWTSVYPTTKALAEKMVLQWGRSGKGRVIALRPHLMWGAGDPHLFPTVIERVKAGRLRMIGDGSNRVDTTRVENASVAHILALNALDKDAAVNRPYFISQGEEYLLWDWMNRVFKAIGMPAVEKRIPYPVAYCAGTVMEWIWRLAGSRKVPPMTRFVARAMAKSHWFSIEAARRELGYCPSKYPTDEGIELYARAWLEGRTPREGV